MYTEIWSDSVALAKNDCRHGSAAIHYLSIRKNLLFKSENPATFIAALNPNDLEVARKKSTALKDKDFVNPIWLK